MAQAPVEAPDAPDQVEAIPETEAGIPVSEIVEEPPPEVNVPHGVSMEGAPHPVVKTGASV